MVDSLRRVATETALPLLLQYLFKGRQFEVDSTDLKHITVHTTSGASTTDALLRDHITLDNYDGTFDDYLEIIIQYGYVTLFASAMPLAPVVSLLTNIVEMNSDLFKLKYVCARPLAVRAAGVGMWRAVIDCMCITAVLTNCLLFALSSEQLMQWLPGLFFRDNSSINSTSGSTDGEHNFREGYGRIGMSMCFGLEHILLVIVCGIWSCIPETPAHVRDAVAKYHYDREQHLHEAITDTSDSSSSSSDAATSGSCASNSAKLITSATEKDSKID
jgi:anoctamin-10